MPMTSSITVAICPPPPGSSGMAKPRPIDASVGWLMKYSGISSSEPTQNVIAIRSNRRNDPVNADAMMIRAAPATAITFGTPR